MRPSGEDDPVACDTCLYWFGIGPGKCGEMIGECRRYAPRATPGFEPGDVIFWPLTEQHQWCGEHELLDRA